ncbi:MAG: hypothetical protein WDW36_001716 [Sanguina aurantia]
MYYMFYEAREVQASSTTPIVLWLQGGPGCSSLFGMLYINGPYFINEEDLSLKANPGSWNRLYGMLFIEQPIGTGYSVRGTQEIPSNELQVADDLYRAIQNFYRLNPAFAQRRLIITGESYAGKYVPSIAHYILQAEAVANGYGDRLRHPRALTADVERPLFTLGGLAVGNGFTDAEAQTLMQAETAWNMGLIDYIQKTKVEAMQREVVELIQSKDWKEARALGDAILKFITDASGSATLEDARRNRGYDGHELVDRFLNQAHVKEEMGIAANATWLSCSLEVDAVLGHDMMHSVRHLMVDLLAFYHVLLYQGQWDAECGYASNDKWISTLKWDGHGGFSRAERRIWHINDRVAGYWKKYTNLDHVAIRNTGHMVPHDNPLYAQLM